MKATTNITAEIATAAKKALLENWSEAADSELATGGATEIAASLMAQRDKDQQGWDMSAEELEEENIAAIVGDTDNWADEDWEAWTDLVCEAAAEWLTAHADLEQMAREEHEMWG